MIGCCRASSCLPLEFPTRLSGLVAGRRLRCSGGRIALDGPLIFFQISSPSLSESLSPTWLSHTSFTPMSASSPSSAVSSSSSTSSTSSTTSSAPFSFSCLQDVPSRLTDALSAVSYPGLRFVSEKYSLPPPGLCVTGLPHQLAFPLLPSQAEQLASLPRDAASGDEVGEGLHVPAAKLEFDNLAWLDDFVSLIDHVCVFLGVRKPKMVHYDLEGLVLYRAGNRVRRRRNVDKAKPVLATLVVQLPSYFKGGEVVFHHNGEETVFANGADDGSNRFNCFFAVSCPDVDREMHPIQEGCRITLVYNLSWTGDGPMPSGNVESVAQVAAALRAHAERRVDGDWHLAFTLAHRYKEDDFAHKGTRALKGVDWRNVNALTVAAKMLGMGELDFVMGKFSRNDVELGEIVDGQFQVVMMEEGDITWSNIYWYDGNMCTNDLKWVDWRAAVQFTQVSQAEPEEEDDGEEVHVKRRTENRADAVVVWARSKRSETLFKGVGFDVLDFLIDGGVSSSSPQDVRAGRMLGCIERRGCDHELAWKQTKVVLEFCLERGFHEQASGAIRFASVIDATEDLEKILYRYVSQHGWDVIGDAVTLYLCPSDITEMKNIDCRLWTLFQLFPPMPARTAMDSLTVVAEFLENHNGNIAPETDSWTPSRTEPYYERLQELWVPLLSVVGELEQNSIPDDEITSALQIVVDGFVTLIDGFTLRQIEPIHDALSNQVTKKSTPQLGKVLACSQRQLFTARAERFAHEANFVIDHKTAFHYLPWWREEYRRYADSRSGPERTKDWVKFMSFCGRVASADDALPETLTLRDKVIETIELLPKRDFDALVDATAWLDESLESEVLLSLEDKLRESRSVVNERDPREYLYEDSD